MGKLVGGVTDFLGLTDIEGTKERANQLAAEQSRAAELGARASAFRPVGMTTRFGTSGFDITDVGGIPRVTGARYEVSPELRAIQDALMGLTGGAVDTATGAAGAAAPLGEAAQRLFGLGAGYLAESPEATRQRVFDQFQAARDPARQREEARLAQSVFGRGRAGLNLSATGQPELFALGRAREEQRLADILAAEDAAQRQIQFGTGLFGTGANLLGQQYALPTQALGPLQGLLGTVGSIEGLGQQPFNLGLAVGGAAQPGAAAGANLLSAGLVNAANTRASGAQAASDQLTGFMNNMLNAAVSGFSGGGGFGGGGGFSFSRLLGTGSQAPAPIYDRSIYY